MHSNYSHSISPSKVIRGEKAWINGKELVPLITKRPLFLGRSFSTRKIRLDLIEDLKNKNLNAIPAELEYDCCQKDLDRIYKIAKQNNCDGIIGAGGGKVLDAGKLIADRLSIPCITIPLSASTCAGWTALANIYSSDGAFIKDKVLKRCPDLLIFDYNIIREAPSQTLSSGIADALAKWYEASLSSSSSTDGLVQQAVQMARVLRDQLFIDGLDAIKNPGSDSWVRVAEGCALTAGLIGGIGGEKCRTAFAHPIHNGLTQLRFRQKALHGEIVGVGILIQLHLEEVHSKNLLANQAKEQLMKFLCKINTPISIESLGLKDISNSEIKKACEFVLKSNNGINDLPFTLDQKQLHKAMLKFKTTENILGRYNLTRGKQ
tara:strand:+ start:5382 stop:6512 length:1131 start_codon:yes stop_codon:yes gene_type:complete